MTRRLRVAVATPDPQLAAVITHSAAGAGHDVAVVTDHPVDAMEAAFSRSVDVLILDQQVHHLAGTEIAAMIRTVGTAVSVVVLHRGELATADDLLVLDPTRSGFEAALANVLEHLVNDPTGGRRAG